MTINELYTKLSNEIFNNYRFGKIRDEEIKNLIESNTNNLEILIIAGICITIILGAAILWNQRKIKKMLRQLEEQTACASKNETQEE